MKLRCKPNSVRLRLNQKEVAHFVQAGELAERIEFPGPEPTVLLYRLQSGSKPGSSSVRFENGELTITVPEEQIRAWANRQDEVGLYYNHEVAGGRSLRVMIEKDYQCLDSPADEIDPAGYPNPLAKVRCKTGTK
ncbi:MAG TPA: hypothetical protein VJY15_09145 [Candidatus Acidoferrum sp.]|nr:hypothetical protein [Candidatus Acidoferrum sp.]